MLKSMLVAVQKIARTRILVLDGNDVQNGVIIRLIFYLQQITNTKQRVKWHYNLWQIWPEGLNPGSAVSLPEWTGGFTYLDTLFTWQKNKKWPECEWHSIWIRKYLKIRITFLTSGSRTKVISPSVCARMGELEHIYHHARVTEQMDLRVLVKIVSDQESQ